MKSTTNLIAFSFLLTIPVSASLRKNSSPPTYPSTNNKWIQANSNRLLISLFSGETVLPSNVTQTVSSYLGSTFLASYVANDRKKFTRIVLRKLSFHPKNLKLHTFFVSELAKKQFIPLDLIKLISTYLEAIAHFPRYLTNNKGLSTSIFLGLFVEKSSILIDIFQIPTSMRVYPPRVYIPKYGNFIILVKKNILSIYDCYTHEKMKEYKWRTQFSEFLEDIKRTAYLYEKVRFSTVFFMKRNDINTSHNLHGFSSKLLS